MRKYDALWNYIRERGDQSLKLTFDEIAQIAVTPIDHAFLNHKKELAEYGYQVGKLSMKAQTVLFHRLDCGEPSQ